MPSRALRVFRAGATAARLLPAPLATGAAAVAGLVAPPLAGGRAAQVDRNLRRVCGDLSPRELRRLRRATFASYAAYWVESFRLPGTPVDALEAGITVTGWEHVEAGLAAGNGVILALPHLGGWEWAGFWVAACRGRPISVVAERLEPPDVHDWFVSLRESFGMHVIPLGPSAGADVLTALKANHVVCLLCDRDLAGGGVPVTFFGEGTTLPGGPATLALRTGAPLLPTSVRVAGDGHHLGTVRPPLDLTRQGRLRDDVARLTQELAEALEDLIRAAPEQWHLLQPNWPSDREAAP